MGFHHFYHVEQYQHTLEIRVTELKVLIATEKDSSTNVDGFKIQRIRIVWNCIGEVVLPHKEKSLSSTGFGSAFFVRFFLAPILSLFTSFS